MMSPKELRSFRSGFIDGMLAFPKAMRTIVLSLKKPELSTKDLNKDIEELLKGSDAQRLAGDFFKVGNDMRKVLRSYDNKER